MWLYRCPRNSCKYLVKIRQLLRDFTNWRAGELELLVAERTVEQPGSCLKKAGLDVFVPAWQKNRGHQSFTAHSPTTFTHGGLDCGIACLYCVRKASVDDGERARHRLSKHIWLVYKLDGLITPKGYSS
ncbi:hypothetical protein AG1IA_09201 [Rhizoctonia solani AG-1 IA]|uniref:Uncharacterized protein n=1 Tax=Thanatephorus cucumeris (strain AG1-IA) TaxID=983506 RepID=L8WF40_THACA|nr:hypothetical protein AG1IA_09201 [Rhizoctonia solani AG-1 IA]